MTNLFPAQGTPGKRLVMRCVLALCLILTTGLKAQETAPMLNEDFTGGFCYEVANRAFARLAAEKLAKRLEGTVHEPLWTNYLKLEEFNVSRYQAVAAKWEVSTVPGFGSRFKATASSICPEFLLIYVVQMMLSATREYVDKLRHLRDIGPSDDADFLNYMVEQEELQVTMMELALAGKGELIGAEVDAFIAKNSAPVGRGR